jgi:hypothetical protein
MPRNSLRHHDKTISAFEAKSKNGRHRLNKAWVQTLGFGAFFGGASFSRHIPTRAGEARLAAFIARVPGIPSIKHTLIAIPFSLAAV